MSETTHPSVNDRQQPRRVLTLLDAVCIIVGTIIGAGIFETTPLIASNAGGIYWLIALWLLGGLLALIGAICFAELTTSNQDAVGGDYVYLKKAAGRPLAFLFAWAAFWVIRPGNIGAMAMIFARYFDEIVPIPGDSVVPYAMLAVVLLSAANLIGMYQGKWVQNILTITKVTGILIIVGLAFLFPADASFAKPSTPLTGGSILLAMVLIMFTFGGWNDISFVAAEIKSPQKNLFRSLVIGTLGVTAIYILINLAFCVGLGFEAMASSQAVAADVVKEALGSNSLIGLESSRLVSALVCISCLGAINGIILTSPRIYFAAGQDYPQLGVLGRWDRKRDLPWPATMAQAAVTVVLLLVCYTYSNAFEVILITTAPVFWLFLGITALTLIILRFRPASRSNTGNQPSPETPGNADAPVFRVPLFPLPPLILAAACLAMVYTSVDYLIANQYWLAAGLIGTIMLIGIGLAVVLKPQVETPGGQD